MAGLRVLVASSEVVGFAKTGGLADVATFLSAAGHWRVLVDLLLIGMFGGFYIVPLYALIQSRSEPTHRSRIIAGNNILNAFFMVLAAMVAIVLFQAGLTIPQLFLVTALLNAMVAIYIYTLVPEFLMRFLVWLLIHSVYRLRKSGLESIPDAGPALLVCNHVSFVDALIIAAACRRPVRFVMDHAIFRIPVLNFVFRTGRAIPIASSRENPQLLEKAYDEIARGLEAGDVICIFPEGRVTDNGEIYPFRPGVSRIVERTPRSTSAMACSSAIRPVASMAGTRPRWMMSTRKVFPRAVLRAPIALRAAPKNSGPLISYRMTPGGRPSMLPSRDEASSWRRDSVSSDMRRMKRIAASTKPTETAITMSKKTVRRKHVARTDRSLFGATLISPMK